MKQMKRLVSFVLAFCMVLSCVPVQAKAAQMPYKDLEPNGWYTEAVQYAYDNGLMNGVETDRFDPEGQTTRAMVVTVLHRMEGSPQVTGKSFPDVEKGFYYEQPVIWAQANNIVNGHSADRFAPNDPVTREQIATILFRYAKYQGHDVSKRTSLKGYKDAGEISSWAEEAMSWAVAVGMIQGVGDNKLDSLGDATRAQIATLLMRYQQKFPKTAFQVTFDLQVEGLVEDESAYSAQTVRKDQKAVKPADPKPAFGQFTGWYTEPECRTKYNFSRVVTQDLCCMLAGYSPGRMLTATA